jgi:hypothetical protein
MNDGYKSWLILGACLAVGCGGGAVDLGGRDATGWADAPSQEADPTRPQTLFEGEARVFDLAVDETTLYALLFHGEQGYELVSCPIDRCRSERSTLSFFRDNRLQTSLVLVADRLYWIMNLGDSGQGVASCPLTGCETPDLALSSLQSGIAGDGEHVYWIDREGWLNRSGADSTEPEKVRNMAIDALASTENRPPLLNMSMLAVAGDHVYSTDKSGIYRIRKDGSEAATRFLTDERIGGFGVTTEALYYTTTTLAGAILSCPLAGCEDQRKAIATNQRWPSEIRINHDDAFWINTVEPRASLSRGSLSS